MSEKMTIERFQQLKPQSLGDYFSQPIEDESPSLAEVFKEPVQPDEEGQVHDEVFTQEGAEAEKEKVDQINIDLNQTTDWAEESTRIAGDMSRQHRMEAGETISQGLVEPATWSMGARLAGASNPWTAAASFIPSLYRSGQLSEEGKAIVDDPEDPRYGEYHLLSMGDRIILGKEQANGKEYRLSPSKDNRWNPTIPETGIRLPIGDAVGAGNEAITKLAVGAGRALDAISPATLANGIKMANIEAEEELRNARAHPLAGAKEIRAPRPTSVMQDINGALNYPTEPGWLRRVVGGGNSGFPSR